MKLCNAASLIYRLLGLGKTESYIQEVMTVTIKEGGQTP